MNTAGVLENKIDFRRNKCGHKQTLPSGKVIILLMQLPY